MVQSSSERAEEDEEVNLIERDRAYLKSLEEWLDMYPEMRNTEDEPDSAHAPAARGAPSRTRAEDLPMTVRPRWTAKCQKTRHVTRARAPQIARGKGAALQSPVQRRRRARFTTC